ncbi:MAG: DUF1631 family protein [Proteobacteria bacterium]|nr:DUF1631 family protein [Pseudomonadota bacterium]
MSDNKRQDTDSPASRSDRRLRHEVTIPASIIGRQSAPIDCEIRDLSSTGMCLAMALQIPDKEGDPLAAGHEASLVFAPDPEHSPADTVTLPVQVMWRRPQGVGIRFLDINERSRAALSTIARLAVDARAGEIAMVGAYSPQEQRKIIGACRKCLDKLLPNIIWAMRTDVSRRLRVFAEEAAPDEAAKARIEADLIDKNASAISRTIEIRFFRSFAKAADLDQTHELKFSDITPDAVPHTDGQLDVIDDQAVEQAAIVTALAHVAEEHYKSTLFELNVRLKDVVGHRMDNESNPLYPTAICRTLWEATIEFCDSPRVRRHLQTAITSRAVPLLGELYETLHKTLDEQGVPHAFDQ